MEEEKPVNACDYCGKPTYLPFKCPYCGGTFCEDHRLPEAHNCPSLRERRYVPHYSEVHLEYSVVAAKKGKSRINLVVYALLAVSVAELIIWLLKVF